MPIRGNRSSVRGRVPRRPLLILLGGLALVAVLVVRLDVIGGTNAAEPARTITVSVQDMKFNQTNPPLELIVGERVAIVVANRESSITHDFAIAGLGVRTNGYLEPGASQTVVFTPGKSGTFKYSCTLHPGLMDGQVVVHDR